MYIHKAYCIISLVGIFFIVVIILLFLQKNVINNNKTIENLEHFIENENENENEILSYFKNKTISHNCCPSTYSTDRGCVCLDDVKDKQPIYTRGNNSKY